MQGFRIGCLRCLHYVHVVRNVEHFIARPTILANPALLIPAIALYSFLRYILQNFLMIILLSSDFY